LAQDFSAVLNRPITAGYPFTGFPTVLRLAGKFNALAHDLGAMCDFVAQGGVLISLYISFSHLNSYKYLLIL
jgi:hypothetical protein